MKKMAMQRINNEAMRQKIKCQCVSLRLLLADRLQYFFSYIKYLYLHFLKMSNQTY